MRTNPEQAHHPPRRLRDWPSADVDATERISTFDWASTPLGALADWPASLSGCVRVMLNTVTPVALAWGNDLTLILNGAWSRGLGGGEHLGTSATSATGAPWPALTQHLRQAMQESREATLGTGEAGPGRFRISPFFGEQGGAAGLWIDGDAPAGPPADWLPFALGSGRLALWDWDAEADKMIWSDEVYRLLGLAPGETRPDPELWNARIHPEDSAGVSRTMRDALGPQGTLDSTFRIVRPDGSTIWCEARGHRIGRTARVVGIVDDITELVLARDRQRRLQHDLMHRVRNVLAVVRSIVLRTAETSNSVDEFASHLDGRITTLARLQSILLQSPEGVDLQTLLLEELRKATAVDGQSSLDGPQVTLPPLVAQTLCLAVHELATNAVKFGALACPTGRIHLTWSVQDDELTMFWKESGFPVPAPPSHRGFGTLLLDDVLPYEIGARVAREFSPSGFFCRIVVPLRSESGPRAEK